MDRLERDRMFIAVIEPGSFTEAAERLGTSSGQASNGRGRLAIWGCRVGEIVRRANDDDARHTAYG